MVVLSSGIEIWVQVGDARVTEYQVENSKRDLIDTTTCFVEAKVDREIRVFYKSLVVESKDQEVIVRLYMDGDKISGSHKDYHRGASQEGELSGRIISKDATQRLKFGKLATTDDATLDCLSLEQLEDFCTIKVEISKVLIKKKRRSKEAKSKEALPTRAVVYENSKPAKWGVSTQPGQMVSKATSICRNLHEPIPDATTEVVIFKYRPNFWLVVKGFCERSPPDDDDGDDNDEIQLDEHRTERAAIKRKAKEDRLNRIGNVKPKIEDQTNKEEVQDGGKKPKPVKMNIDLTAEEE